MIIVLKHNISAPQKEQLIDFLVSKGLKVREIAGEEETILGAVGVVKIDIRQVELFPGVAQVIPISKPYKLASRELKKQDTIISIGPVKIGGQRVAVIAGPCAVESREQILESAKLVRAAGGVMLRGGAFKPRTSPYSFQGMGEEGLKCLKDAGEAAGLPVVTEILATEHSDMLKEYADVLQIGARNMQNFELLKKVGTLNKPVILKRGLAATIEEWLMAAEYLLAHGAEDVILCERGIRTFETYTRNTLDLSAIPVVKKLSHLPVIVDPSHATGIREKVLPMALAAIAAGADGLTVEMHPHPENALSDGPQSLFPEQLEKLMRDIEALSPVIGKEVERIPESETAQIKVSLSEGGDKLPAAAFQGARGAYSEIAVNRYFGEDTVRALPCTSFADVFKAVLSGEAAKGIIPIENSLAGSIHENYDLLLQHPDICISGEQKIRIEHNLIGLPEAELAGIKKAFSHPQGLAQCAAFLDTNGIEKVPYYDTAGSVQFISEQKDPSLGAVASSKAAEVYRMKVLKPGIETNPRNYTRFFIIERGEAALTSRTDKASVVFSAPDKPGALLSCLTALSDRQLNMTKLESRPIQGRPWEYMFYIDLEIPEDRDGFTAALTLLEEMADSFRVLGMYKS